MNFDAGLIVARFVHYSALMVLFGAALFPLYAYPRPTASSITAAWSEVSARRALFAAATLALVSGVFWLAFAAAQMTGEPGAIVDPGVLSLVVGQTRFGRVWTWRLLALALLCVLLLTIRIDGWTVRSALSAVIVGSSALVGHASTSSGAEAILRITSDGLHLLAAGVWLGGLVPLAAELTRDDAKAQSATLFRFSAVASLAVAVLVLSGLVNSWFLVGRVERLFDTPYGQVLLFKLVLFLGMVILACANRFWLLPRLATAEGPIARIRLRQHVVAELALGAGVLLAVAALGTVEPPV